MTNAEKYRTAEERYKAHVAWCGAKRECPSEVGKACRLCSFRWLDFEAEEEKPMPCPFCGGDCEVIDEMSLGEYYSVRCNDKEECWYTSGKKKTSYEAVAAHNSVCKAVKAYKESEEK